MGFEGYLVFGAFFLFCIIEMRRSDTILYYSDDNAKKKQAVYLAFVLFLLGALRSYHTGIDTYYYAMKFKNEYSAIGFMDAFKLVKEAGIDGEIAYSTLAKLFKLFIPSAQLWLAFIWGIFVLECKKVIYKFSENVPMSYIYLVASLITTFMWQGLRQCIAATVCLVSFRSLTEKKYLKYAVFMLIAFLFHRSSLIFLLAVPALFMPVGIWGIVLILAAFVMSNFMPSNVVNYLMEITDIIQMEGISQKMDSYLSGVGTRTGTLSYFLVLFVLYIACYFVKSELILKDKNNKFLLNLSMFGVCIQAMCVVIPEFFRVSYYFSIFNMILLANACSVYSERFSDMKVRQILISALILMFFYVGGFNYWFFWQQSAW